MLVSAGAVVPLSAAGVALAWSVALAPVEALDPPSVAADVGAGEAASVDESCELDVAAGWVGGGVESSA